MKHDKKKYLKKTVVVTASTMLAVNSVLASPLLLNVSAAEETRVTQRITKESKIARESIVNAQAKSEIGDNTIDKSLDNNPSTYTDSNYNDTNFELPQVYTFELDGVKRLSKVRILPRTGDANKFNGRVASYNVLVSNDGVTYTSVKEGTIADPNASDEWITIEFDPTDAKFVKLELRPTDENFAQVHVVTTAEVELYETITVEEADKSELESLYNQSKDFQPHFNQSQDYFDYFQGKLVEAKTVLDNPSATQEEVNSKVRGLTQAYYIVLNLEFNYKYGISVKDGSFTNPYINYSEYLTSDLRSVMQVRYESAKHLNSNYGNNTLRPEENENLINWYNQFVEADKNLKKADSTNLYGKMVGLNPDAADATARGTFEVSEEKEVIEDGKKKIQLHVVFKNDAKHPITNTIRDKDNNGNKYEKWKSGDLKNFSISMDGESYTGETDPRGSISVDDTNAFDGVEFDVVVEPGIYRFKLHNASSVRSATPGYYHTNLIQEEEGTVSSLINGEKVSGDSLRAMIESSGIEVNEVTSLELTKGTVTQDDLAYLQELSYLEDFTMNLSDTLKLEAKDGSFTTVLGEGENQAQIIFAPNRSLASKGDIVNVRMEGITEVHENGIDGGSIEELYLPDVVTVGDNAFSTVFPWLETLALNNAETVGVNAFNGCKRLTKLTLEQVEILKEGSFKYTDALKKLTLPATLKTIENIGFGKVSSGNKNGTKITLLSETPPEVAVGAFKGVGGTNTPVFIIPKGSMEAYCGKSSDAFMKRTDINWNDLHLRESGSYYIEYRDTKNMPAKYFVAFVPEGEAIGEARLPEPTETVEGKVFKEWNTKKNGSGDTITAETVLTKETTAYPIFVEKTEVVNAKINGVDASGASILEMITSADLTSKDVESIEFVNHAITTDDLIYINTLTNLTDLTMNLGENVTFLGEDGQPTTILPEKAFEDNHDIETLSIAGFTEIGKSAFENTYIENFNMPDVKVIGTRAFKSNRAETLDLPNVTVIGIDAFNGNENIETINMPKVERIENSAFYCASNFEEFTLPATIKFIGTDAFDAAASGSRELNVTIETATPPEVEDGAFATGTITVPEGSLPNYLSSLDLTKTFTTNGSSKWKNLTVQDSTYHHITFYYQDGGTAKSYGYIKDGEALNSVTVIQLKIPEGKVFKEWNTKKDGSGEAIAADAVITEDLTVYAIFEEAKPDTVAPKVVNDEWSTRHSTNDPVEVILTFSEPIKTLVEKVDKEPTGHEWEKVNDVTYRREYTENANYKIYFEDFAGNAGSEKLLIVDNYFTDPLVKEVYFTGVHLDEGSHVEIELNAKPNEIRHPNSKYEYKDGKHLLVLDVEALATNEYFNEVCLTGNDNRDSADKESGDKYEYPATWSYIYRDENGKLSVGRIESVEEPEVILTIGDKQYNLNENKGSSSDPFVLPEAGYIGLPITVDVRAPYIGDVFNKKPVTTVHLTGVAGESPTAADVATNHQSAQMKLVSMDGTTKSGTYCLSVNYNFSPDQTATYYVKVDYSKKLADKSELQKLYDEASKFEGAFLSSTDSERVVFELKLNTAKTILDTASATQDVVDNIYDELKLAYQKAELRDLHKHYAVKWDNFDYKEYTTESAKALVSAAESAGSVGSDTNFEAEIQAVKDALTKLVPYDGSAKTYYGIIEDAILDNDDRGGYFTIEEVSYLDQNNNPALRLKVIFHNTGIDDVTGKKARYGKFSESALKNGKFAITYLEEDGTTSRVPYGNEYFRPLDGETTFDKGLYLNIGKAPQNTEIVDMEIIAGGYTTHLSGYYLTGEIEIPKDETAPEVEVSYATNETKDSVKVTLTANEAIKAVDGWKQVNKTTLEKVYTENKTETITVTDLAGNETEVTVTVDSIIEKVQVTFKDREGNELDSFEVEKGTGLSLDQIPVVEDEFDDNHLEFLFRGWIGPNESTGISAEALVKKYAKLDSDIEFKADMVNTNNIAVVKVIYGSGIYTIPNANLPTPDYWGTKFFTLPGRSFTLADGISLKENDKDFNGASFMYWESEIAGWTNKKPGDTIVIGNTPKIMTITPVFGQNFTYDTGTEQKQTMYPVNYDTYVEKDWLPDLADTEDAKFLGWEINGKLYETREAVEKAKIPFKLETKATAVWEEIDKTAPEVKVTYSNNNGSQVTADDVVVTLTANEAIKDIEGWTRVADNVLTKTFDKNGKHTVIVTDLAGNTTNVKFEVKRIDKTAPVITGVEDGVYYASDVTYGIKEQSIRKIYVDGVAYDEKKAPRTISEEGKHTIRVVDKAGNEASVSFVIDKTKPVVKVRDENGNAVGSQYTMTLTVGDEYFEFGALVNDNLEGEVVLDGPTNINYVGADGKVVAVDAVDTSKAGEYRLGYLFTDKAGNKQMARRIVKIVEKEEPEVPVEPQEPDPEVPVEPENPETPDTPETPETPEVPDVPETPDTPTPQEPGVEVGPINPIVPETPTVPQTPDAPAVVVTPVQPRLPVAVVDPQEEVDPVEDPEVEPENIEDPDTPQGGGEDIDDQETPLAKNDGISMEALLYSGLGLLLLVAIIVGAYEINKKRKAGSN